MKRKNKTRNLHFSSQGAWSLLEMLVVMALFVCFAALSLSSWQNFQKSISLHHSADLLINTLEEARATALQYRTDTWVVFQHRSAALGDRYGFFKKPEDRPGKCIPQWVKLPPGITLQLAVDESPSDELIQMLPEYDAAENDDLRALCYNSQGVIVFPAHGENQLFLELMRTSKKKVVSEQIILSRLTGRARVLQD